MIALIILLLALVFLTVWLCSRPDPRACEWRVYYPDGERTYRIPLAEAQGLRDCFGGRVVHDPHPKGETK